MKTSELITRWWHRFALVILWVMLAGAVAITIIATISFVLNFNNFGSKDRIELLMTVLAAIASPLVFWGLYRAILWIAVGVLESDAPTSPTQKYKATTTDEYSSCPQREVDSNGCEVKIVELKWHHKLWCCMPLLLFVFGGAIGALCGGLGWMINRRIFTKTHHVALRYLWTILSTALSVFTWIVLSRIFIEFVNPHHM